MSRACHGSVAPFCRPRQGQSELARQRTLGGPAAERAGEGRCACPCPLLESKVWSELDVCL